MSLFEVVHKDQAKWVRFYISGFHNAIHKAYAYAEEYGYANIWDRLGRFICKVTFSGGKSYIDYHPDMMHKYMHA